MIQLVLIVYLQQASLYFLYHNMSSPRFRISVFTHNENVTMLALYHPYSVWNESIEGDREHTIIFSCNPSNVILYLMALFCLPPQQCHTRRSFCTQQFKKRTELGICLSAVAQNKQMAVINSTILRWWKLTRWIIAQFSVLSTESASASAAYSSPSASTSSTTTSKDTATHAVVHIHLIAWVSHSAWIFVLHLQSVLLTHLPPTASSSSTPPPSDPTSCKMDIRNNMSAQ